MDNTDRKILKCLRENSRENASVIGEKINMSVSAVIERIKKLVFPHPSVAEIVREAIFEI